MSYYKLATDILDSITDESGHCGERYLSTSQGKCLDEFLVVTNTEQTGCWKGDYGMIPFFTITLEGYIGRYYVRMTEYDHFHTRYQVNSVDRWIDSIPDPKDSDYLYAAGDRVETDLTLISSRKYEHYSWNGNDTESGTIYTFIDSSGNYYKWFTDSVLMLENKNDSLLDVYPRPGDTCHVRATVKRLSEYRGNKETILSRVRVASVDRASVNVALNL